jgi:hypothetical protein
MKGCKRTQTQKESTTHDSDGATHEEATEPQSVS